MIRYFIQKLLAMFIVKTFYYFFKDRKRRQKKPRPYPKRYKSRFMNWACSIFNSQRT